MNSSLIQQFDTVADGLAEHGYAVVDNFLNPEEVNLILNSESFKNGSAHFHRAAIGQQKEKQINETIRGDYIHWIDPQVAQPAIQIYLKRLRSLIQHLNQSLFLSLKDFEVHQTIYPVGTFYKRHLDQFKKDDHRKLSVICYLNHEWTEHDGGQLRIYLPDDSKDYLPLAGRLVCFRSDLLEHEVLPAKRVRLSITGWILDQVSDLRHL